MGPTGYYIIIIYSILFQRIVRKIAGVIMKDFNRLSYYYRRQLLSSVYFRKAQKLSEKGRLYLLKE
jgi:hypothetical protein